jgi:hypothetical protein
MYPATMQKISTAQGREMREQATAWRRARQARATVRARPARIRFALSARPTGNAGSVAGQQRLHGPAAA